MDDQGGAGGVPLHHDEGEAKRRAPRADQPARERPAKSGEPQDRRSERTEGDQDRNREGKGPAKGPE
ncbi:hypothetical protein GCM10010347_27690 [Streptomyces cirratus]|uniref:Uncharacterized protein n=1 Tax=Streptomyces cirratus TaxID=68187 RepID=A0ABQ3EWC6_9ACTN|nr:hypothetical protein [Streptomyces cirratus]GHB56114.1 hypothetical protein GCM10010347_27690 [Streptomyces cirratus]